MRMRLLLIEDNRDLSADVADVLKSLGNTLEYASDETQGLRLASGDGGLLDYTGDQRGRLTQPTLRRLIV